MSYSRTTRKLLVALVRAVDLLRTRIVVSVTGVAILALMSTGASAQAVTRPEMGLAAAVEKAILTNLEVLARWHNYRAAASDQQVARSGYRPRIDAQAFTGREDRKEPGSASSDYTHNGYLIELRQMLFDGFGTRSQVEREGFTKLARYYDLLAITDETAYEVTRAYLDVLRHRRLAKLARKNWEVHKELFDQIARRTRAGVGRGVDLEQAAGRLALAQSNWLTDKTNLHDVSERYLRLVGMPPGETLPPPGQVRQHIKPEVDVPVSTLSNNPTFRSAIAEVRARRAGRHVERANNYPTFEFRASHGSDSNLNGVSGDTDISKLQLVLNYNLYKGGGDSARIRSARESFYAAIDLRDKTCRDVRQQTAIAWNEMRQVAEQIRYLEQHELSTEKARTAYRQQFDIGQRTLLDLLDTENEYFSAKRAVLNARHDQLQAEYRVLAFMHRILPALGLAPLAKQAPEEAALNEESEDAAIRCNTEMALSEPLELNAVEAPRATIQDKEMLASSLSQSFSGSSIKVERTQQNVKISIPGSVVFANNSVAISTSFHAILDELTAALKQHPQTSVRIIGHTGSTGSENYNLRLSERRASEVANYLSANGIAAKRITSAGQGERNPVATNKTAAGRAKNRRVEVLVSQ